MGQGFVSIRSRCVAAILATLIATWGCSPRPPQPGDLEKRVWNASLTDLASVLVESSTPEQLAVTVKAHNLGPSETVDVTTRVTAVGGTFGPLPSGCVSLEPSVALCTYNEGYEVFEGTATSPATLQIIPSPGEPVVAVTAKTTFGGELTYNDSNHSNDTATVSFLAGPVSAYVTGDVTVGGSGGKVTGKVVGGGAVKVSGAGHQLTGGVVYGTTLTVTGAGNLINPVGQKGSTNLESIVDLVSWRPGGGNAIARGSDYFNVSQNCVGTGDARSWTPPIVLVTGTYYADCRIVVSGANRTFNATFVSEKDIQLTGAANKVLAGSGPALVSGGNVQLSGANVVVNGQIQAVGSVAIQGANTQSTGGLVASSVTINGAGIRVDP